MRALAVAAPCAHHHMARLSCLSGLACFKRCVVICEATDMATSSSAVGACSGSTGHDVAVPPAAICCIAMLDIKQLEYSAHAADHHTLRRAEQTVILWRPPPPCLWLTWFANCCKRMCSLPLQPHCCSTVAQRACLHRATPCSKHILPGLVEPTCCLSMPLCADCGLPTAGATCSSTAAAVQHAQTFAVYRLSLSTQQLFVDA